MQYLSPTWKGGIFVNVDFDVLGQGLGLTPHSGTRDPSMCGGANTAINFLLLFVTRLVCV